MTEPEDFEEDLFADLYDGDEAAAQAAQTSAASQVPAPTQTAAVVEDTIGLDFNPGGHGEENENNDSNGLDLQQFAEPGNYAQQDEQMKEINTLEQEQQDQLFGTGIKEDG